MVVGEEGHGDKGEREGKGEEGKVASSERKERESEMGLWTLLLTNRK